MTIARKDIVAEGVERAYHCTIRCVRRSFLCGFDRLTGKNYDHRKKWIRERLILLSQLFAVEVLGYSIMSDHAHVVPRPVPNQAREWSAEEVARRWLAFRRAGPAGGPAEPVSAADVAAIVRDPARVEVLRGRLTSLSWFMGGLDEHLARRANAEDECTGRFWEGRFKCKALLDEAALLTCMIYVDLNPIRAGLAATPEASDFTSIQDRIVGRTGRERERVLAAARAEEEGPALEREVEQADAAARADTWLCSLAGEGERSVFRRLTLDEYLRLLDATGRIIRTDKRGSIPRELAPILARLAIAEEEWVAAVDGFDHRFRRMVGRAEQVAAEARAAGRRWFQGICACRAVFG